MHLGSYCISIYINTIYIASVNFYILISLSWLTSTPVAAAHSMFFATATLPLLFPYHITPTFISYLSPLIPIFSLQILPINDDFISLFFLTNLTANLSGQRPRRPLLLREVHPEYRVCWRISSVQSVGDNSWVLSFCQVYV